MKKSQPYTVQLIIDQEVMEKLRQGILAKRICDSFFGEEDEFILLIIEGWKKKASKLHIKLKKKGKR